MSRLGIPRTDVLFGDDRVARRRRGPACAVRDPDGHRVILYAPTFRGDSVADATAE